MVDLKKFMESLDRYIRPQSFPVAARLCQSESELPERVKIPIRDLKMKLALCQGVGMARRYGWTVAVGNEDQNCVYGSLTMGFLPAKKEYLDGGFMESIASTVTGPLIPYQTQRDPAARTAQTLKRLEYGKYSHLLLSPLHDVAFEPHFIIVYGNSAQMTRLAQGALWERGGGLPAMLLMGVACSLMVANTMLTDECQFILPCHGDRILGTAQDHEMSFTVPMSKVEQMMRGLAGSHKTGVYRYPVPSQIRFEAEFPETYQKLRAFLEKQDPE